MEKGICAGQALRLGVINKAFEPFEQQLAADTVWARIPEEFRKMGSVEFSKLLLTEAQVAVSPGLGFGAYGDEYVRFALIENDHRTRQAVRNIRRLLGGSSD